VFATVTRQNIVAKNGDNAGRQLKAVPRHALSAGITGGPPRLQGTLSVSEMGGAFLDDANQRRLPAYTRVDARVTATAGALRFNCDVINVLDRKLISTGFPDPSGTGVVYYYPAARRTLQIGIGSAW
jgi:outer membrane receptor protein involved in Fe transport